MRIGLPGRDIELSRLTVVLAIFALANLLVVALVLLALPSTGARELGLYDAYRWATFQANFDSWGPITEAWEFLQSPNRDQAVYQEVFFDRNVKFQYALTSLLPVEALDLLFGKVKFGAFDLVSWFAMWGTAVLVALIFLRSLDRYAPQYAPASRLEQLLLAALAMGMTLTFYPLAKAFSLGQIQTWINALFALLVYLWMIKRPVAAGVVGGLICAIKPQLGLLLVWGLLRRRWGFSGAFAVTLGLVGLLTLALYGLEDNLDYLNVLSYISRRGEGYYPNQSVNGLLNRLLENGQNRDFAVDAFPPFDPVVYVITILSSLVIVGGCLFWRAHEHERASTVDLLIAGLSFTIASPVAWEHHYGVLMPMYAVLLPALLRWRVFGAWTLPLLAASYVLTSQFFHAAQEFADWWYLTPLQSYLLAGALFVLVTLYLVRQREAADGSLLAEEPAPQPSNSAAPAASASTIS